MASPCLSHLDASTDMQHDQFRLLCDLDLRSNFDLDLSRLNDISFGLTDELRSFWWGELIKISVQKLSVGIICVLLAITVPDTMHNGTGAGISATFEVVCLRFCNISITATRNAARLRRKNQKYIMCANFEFLGQKVESPGQVKVRCALRDRL